MVFLGIYEVIWSADGAVEKLLDTEDHEVPGICTGDE
jgi:hypothetical protein